MKRKFLLSILLVGLLSNTQSKSADLCINCAINSLGGPGVVAVAVGVVFSVALMEINDWCGRNGMGKVQGPGCH